MTNEKRRSEIMTQLKRLRQKRNHSKFLVLELKNLKYRIEIPSFFKDNRYIFHNLIEKLDESKSRPPINNFQSMNAINMALNATQARCKLRRY